MSTSGDGVNPDKLRCIKQAKYTIHQREGTNSSLAAYSVSPHLEKRYPSEFMRSDCTSTSRHAWTSKSLFLYIAHKLWSWGSIPAVQEIDVDEVCPGLSLVYGYQPRCKRHNVTRGLTLSSPVLGEALFNTHRTKATVKLGAHNLSALVASNPGGTTDCLLP